MNTTTATNTYPMYRAVCGCGWHGRKYKDGNAAWGSLDNHLERCDKSRFSNIVEVK